MIISGHTDQESSDRAEEEDTMKKAVDVCPNIPDVVDHSIRTAPNHDEDPVPCPPGEDAPKKEKLALRRLRNYNPDGIKQQMINPMGRRHRGRGSR